MRLAIMQPYFFPYIGYFQLITATDKFIVFDVVQYIKHGWMNRNRILSPNSLEGWQYILVPLKKNKQHTIIKDVKIFNQKDWLQTILGQLSYYKKINAPYYNDCIELIFELKKYSYSSLVELNVKSLVLVCNYLDLKFNYEICSQKDLNFENVRDSGDWALEISKSEKATIYINPIGGIYLFDKINFLNNGITLKYLKTKDIFYRQSKREFISSLSILDVMMFNSKDYIKELLNEYELI